MISVISNYRLWITLVNTILLTIVIISCETKSIEQPEEEILVIVNDSMTISKNEFIRRAEYAIRPPYCKRNSYIDKKIILNSLIAEKLLASEAGQDNPLLKNDGFQLFIQGRREQAMRQWMYHKEAIEKVRLDAAEINKYYQYAGREYTVAYYTIQDIAALKMVMKKTKNYNGFFEEFFRKCYGDTPIPEKKVVWRDLEPFNVLESLYTDNVYKGKVLAPLAIDENSYLIIKVLGWTDAKALTDSQIKERKRKVVERLKNEGSAKIWNDRVAEIMRGKKVDFNGSVLQIVCDIFAHEYLKTNSELREVLRKSMWHEADTMNAKIGIALDKILTEPFFSVNGTIWTVDDFKRELMSHPIVFRKRKIAHKEFPQQFRLAVVDLIRDYFITKEAYNKGYDQVNSVKREEETWRDAYLAIYKRDIYLKDIGELENFSKNYLNILTHHLNAYVASLISKYENQIRLDIDEFERISLTNIDLYIQQPYLPYKQAVPGFPILTTNHYLGYLAAK